MGQPHDNYRATLDLIEAAELSDSAQTAAIEVAALAARPLAGVTISIDWPTFLQTLRGDDH